MSHRRTVMSYPQVATSVSEWGENSALRIAYLCPGLASVPDLLRLICGWDRLGLRAARSRPQALGHGMKTRQGSRLPVQA